jgi:site-specific DNA-methyltransferase (adenine-specific)
MAAHTIILGDSRQMREVDSGFVHLIVTSPPYWQLKDYGAVGQIGFNDSYEDYINNLNCVWMECARVLHGGCRLCVVLGDQFARSVFYGRYKIIPIRTEVIRFCETIGFDFMGAVIWQKLTTCNTTGGATVMGSYGYPRNGVVKLDYESILIFRKGGEPPVVSDEAKRASKITPEEWNVYFAGHWRLPGERQDRHLAVFPEEVPRRLIRMFSFAGETVLDPFLGSGTTTLAAERTGRDSIGYEINRDALPVIEEKLGLDALIHAGSFRVVKQKGALPPQDELYARLPYLFKDPVPVVRRMDPRDKDFGSRVAAAKPKKRELYSVKEVRSPEEVVLSNGDVVRLMGVKANGLTDREAVAFLEEATKNQRVYVKTEGEAEAGAAAADNGVVAAPSSARPCYLYLKNKTFLNAHLIKKGLVDVDLSSQYAKRYKFLSYLPPPPSPIKKM